jgi:iron complex outermembrane receptor protein
MLSLKKQLILLFSSIQVLSFSQLDTIKTDLNEIQVSAIRIKVLYRSVAQNVVIISKEQIQNSPARSLQEVLSMVAGVDVRQRGVGGVQADIGIRGGSFEQTLFLLNGVKLTDPQTGHHAMNIPIPLDAIERIEVIKGPSTRVYGQNAFAGAVNIITKLGKQTSVVSTLYGADFNSFGGSLYVNIPVKNRLKQAIAISKDVSDGYWYNSDYQVTNLNYEANFRLNATNEVKGVVGYAMRDFGANGYYSKSYPDQWEATKTGTAALTHVFKTEKFTLQSRVYLRTNQDEFRLKKNVPSFYTNRHRSEVKGAEVNATYQSKYGITGLGLEARDEAIISSNLGERNRQFIGLFLEHKKTFWDKVDVNIGIHSTRYSTNSWKHFPGIEVGYNVLKSVRSYINYGLSYRVPTYTELFYVDPTTTSNANLSVEEAKTIDVGLIFTKNSWRMELVYFNRQTTNLIDYVRDTSSISPNPNKWTPKNIGKVNFNGFEFSGKWSPKFKSKGVKLQELAVSYNFIDANVLQQNELESKYALSALHQQFIASMTLELFGKIRLVPVLRHIERMNLNAYTLVDAKLIYQHHPKFKWFAEVSNVFDEDYTEAGYVQMPGRWVKIGINLRLE